jgi:hypothetical protein
MATVLPPVADVLSGFREGLRERGERGSELIRIYIHTANETENEPPIITIINGYDKESILTDYVVVARDGRVLAAGKMEGSLSGIISGIRIPAGARIDLTPADFGLSYGTFAAMADEVKAIYIRTAEGNSFGSSYGPPPKITVDYQIVTVLATSSATTTSVVTKTSVVTATKPSGSSGGTPSTPSSSSSSSGGGGGSSSGGGGGGGGTGPTERICTLTAPNKAQCQTPDQSGSGSSDAGGSSSSSGSGGTSGSSGGGSSSGSRPPDYVVGGGSSSSSSSGGGRPLPVPD